MQKYVWILLLLTTFSFLESYNVTPSIDNQKKKEYKILFVGNSLTYTNNLPLLVKKSAKEKGIKLTTEMLAFPNYGLEDHMLNPSLKKRIIHGGFDFVIVQQGPSSL